MRRIGLLAITAALLLLASGSASGAALEQVGIFQEPIYVTSDPGDYGRLLIAERSGVIVETSGREQRVWADLRDLVLCCEGERGLLSIAPAPNFHESDRLYVAYTGESAAGGSPGDVHIDAFRHGAGALIREPILSVPHSSEDNHNGGQLQFGPEGSLYASFGDGGGNGDPFGNAQNLETLLGKLIRIDPRPGAGIPSYVVPSDNPFIGQPAADEIWGYGLRNPWRFSFDRGTGALVIADVGQEKREEIDFAPRLSGEPAGRGANYEWNCREGSIAFPGAGEACADATGFQGPVFDYPHEDPGDGSAHGCAIVGGYVVRDESVSDLNGRYLYGDFCLGAVRSIDLSSPDPRATDRPEPQLDVPPYSLDSFGEDSCGRVYVVTRSGPVYRVVGGQPNPCGSTAAPPPGPGARSPRTKVGLRVVRGRHGLVRIKARVRPCAGNRGRRLILKRGGRRLARKRVRGRCVVRFRTRVTRRTSFRALLPLGPGAGIARSRRVVVRGPRG
jgi:hypothetical protein